MSLPLQESGSYLFGRNNQHFVMEAIKIYFVFRGGGGGGGADRGTQYRLTFYGVPELLPRYREAYAPPCPAWGHALTDRASRLPRSFQGFLGQTSKKN